MDCPAYKGSKGFLWFPGAILYNGGSYGYNGFGTRSTKYVWVSGGDMLGIGGDKSVDTNNFLEPVSPARVRASADMIAIGDSMITAIQATPGIYLTLLDGGRVAPERHNGGANIAFCDGHVENMQNSKLVEPTETARRRWNNDNEPHMDEINK